MPPLRRQRSNRRAVEKEDPSTLPQVDVKYNTELLQQVLRDLSLGVDAKCTQINNDTEFMITSMQQMFHLELIKLPSQVKHMSMKRFREEFGCSLEAVTRGAISGAASVHNKPTAHNAADKIVDRNVARNSIYQTPQHNQVGKKLLLPMQTPSMRNPKEGETILSTNGSPLGQFTTAKKGPKPANCGLLVPPTPGVFVPTANGEVMELDDIDIDNMTTESKLETFQQMQAMMDNMKAMMEKFQAKM
jgi:hypothetical protein